MVDSGQATVQQIDDAITYGPGLRWAQMGPPLTFHLAGGQGGTAHMLDHFGPAMLGPRTRLAAPELTPRLRDLVVSGVDESVGDVTVQQLERQRDDFLADRAKPESAAGSQSRIRTLRAPCPARSASNASFSPSSPMRRVMSSSSSRFPARYSPASAGTSRCRWADPK